MGEDHELSDEASGSDAFARIVRAAYLQVRQGIPRAISEVEERLRGKLAAHGVVLTTDVVRALAFATVNGSDL